MEALGIHEVGVRCIYIYVHIYIYREREGEGFLSTVLGVLAWGNFIDDIPNSRVKEAPCERV